MIRGIKTVRSVKLIPLILLGATFLQAGVNHLKAQESGEDSSDTDLQFPTNDEWNEEGGASFRLPPPKNYDTELDYNPSSGQYQLQPTLGDSSVGPSRSMPLDDYLQEDSEESMDEYWQKKRETQRLNRRGGTFKPSLEFGGNVFDRIFGGNNIDIQPQGSAELTFGVNVSKTENPQIPEKQRKISTFDFDQQIQLNVTGTVGDKLELRTNYNTESQFDFQNQMKLEYTGYEDEIIKKIEAGNVSLPINSSLISGSQSLFGVKTKLQFGRLKITSVFSQQKGDKKEIEVQGGSQTQQFEFKADEYERNQHYFLSHYFRNNYNENMKSLPQINTGVNITRVEVWVTNKNNNTQNTRNIVALSDLGESEGPDKSDPNYHQNMGIKDTRSGHLPGNGQNNIYEKVDDNANVRSFFNANTALRNMSAPGPFDPVEDFEMQENARKLKKGEYTVNKQLGFISLDRALDQDEVLAVSFEYSYQGETYQVGEFSTDGTSGQEALILKMLKSTNTNPTEKVWDLMMKNVYSINAYQMNKKNFDLQVLYNDPKQGVNINYIPQGPIDGTPLIRVLNCDQLNQNNRPYSDGIFDFVDNAATEGGTVESSNGKIYFPVVEPFGDHLRRKLEEGGLNENVIQNIAFEPLYDSTITAARQIPQLNRFKMKGSYESSVGSEINLNAMNIPEGSVKVTAGGVKLEEGSDYTVDYTLGRVKILNEGLLQSQTEINVSLESNSGFNVQTKRLMGSRFDYRVSEDMNIGATVLNLTERPLTQKVNIGNEPMSNTMIGADMSYQTESKFLTKMVDKIPLIDTKKKSSIDFNAEYARLIPGHADAIGDEGNAYIDDFEGSQSTIDLRSITRWQMASTPQGQPNLFPEAKFNDSLIYNYNRANLSWYVIDPLFFRNNNLTPDHISNNASMRSDHRMREVLEQEVFPDKELPQGTPPNIAVLDLAYYPSERGQYNFDTKSSNSNVSAGLEPDGSLDDPDSRWGGVMRKLQTTDFEQSNIEYIQFWLMDPFNEDSENNSGGDLYFNLGNVSEDILKDSRKSFENGMPTSEDPAASKTDTTNWGRVPNTQSVVNAFSNDPSDRKFQDIGFDGLDNEGERDFFTSYLNKVENVVNGNAYQDIQEDPAGDDYNYYRDDDYDDQELNILQRYKKYNGVDGNSPTTEQAEKMNEEGYPTSATTRPDAEDIDRDNNMNTTESYFQYKVSLRPGDMQVGENYISDKRVAYPDVPNGNDKQVTWYQFKIPVRDFSKRVNNIRNFRSIRFMRIFMKDWEEQVVLRFARLELIRGDWRRYTDFGLAEGEYVQDDPPETNFNIAAVNIEENANRDPINYVLPPDITREVNNRSTNLSKLNEQSLALEVCNLQDGDARAAFRNMEMDIRRYKRIKMYAHLESPEQNVEAGDVTLFLRFGTDFKRNYYEYEIPLKPTSHDATTPGEIWPDENRIDFKMKLLKRAKKKRNALVSQGQMSYNERYTLNEGDARVTVVGTPNLADMKTVMIGVRNPGSQKDHPYQPDDGLPKCFEVWVNELRLNQFEEEGGWAATAKMNAQLADLGNVSVSGNISTPGFGGLDDKINDRQRFTKKRINASSNLKLSKFFPEAGIKLPLYMGYSEGVEEPQFDPLNPDLNFDSSLSRLEPAQREARRKKSVTYRKQRSFNLTNVTFESGKGSTPIYHPSNLSLSYSYNENFMRDINTEYRTNKTYNGNLNYSYSPEAPTFEPFKNIGLFDESDYFDLIQDFNFKPYPSSFSFNNSITRNYTERQTRSNTDAITPAQANKQFDWTRNYNLTWSLTENLELDYQANDRAIIGEPPGQIDSKNPEWENREGWNYQEYKDTVWRNIKKFGENTSFQQSVNASYQVPIKKIPIFDWIQANAQYNASYNWQRAPFAQDSLGNTIQNSRKISLNGNLDLKGLYNKVGFLKKVRQKFKGGGRSQRNPDQRRSMENREDGDGGDDEDDENSGPNVLDHALNFLMSVEKVSLTYSENEGTMLPGYDKKTEFVGMDPDFDAPGYKFLLGDQDSSFKRRAAENGWLVEQPNLNKEYRRNRSEQFNMRATMRPANRLRIQLKASRQESWTRNSFFRYNDSLDTWQDQSPQRNGNLSMSILTWRTAFRSPDSTGASKTFQTFVENRRAYSEQYGKDHANSNQQGNGYYDGYGGTQQDVVISSFLAAYTGKKPKNLEKDPFKMIPKPNWSITYDGLSQLPFFKDYVNNLSLSHSYSSRMNTSYQTPLQHKENAEGDPIARNQEENFIPERRAQNVTISESFSPIIGVDITWANDITTKFEIKKSRNLSLSLSNYQVNEVRSQEYTIGAGYSFQDVLLPFKVLGNELKSDLKLRADVSIRDNKTYIRKMVEDQNEITSGQRIISIKTSADYSISRRLNLRLFYDRTVNDPYISNTYPTKNTNFGLTLRLTLAQ